MNRIPHGREFNVKGCAPPRSGTHVNHAGVFLDDPVAHGETQAGAAASGLGSEKRVEYLMDVIAGNPVARVRYFDFYAAVMRPSAHFQDPARGHGVAGIQEEI